MRVRRLRQFVRPRTGELVTFESKQYYVTDEGQVYDGTRKRYLTQHEIFGYMHVVLRDDNGQWHTSIRVHNLVASVFLRLLERGEVVHHINRICSDNRLENIEIIDAKEHARQHNHERWRSGTYDGLGEKIRKKWSDGTYDGVATKLRNVGSDYRPAKQVAQITKDGQLIKVWPSTNEAGRNGFDSGHVSECCNGKRKSHKGFRWQWYV